MASSVINDRAGLNGAILPEQKKIDLAVIIGPKTEDQTYNTVFRVGQQLEQAYKHCYEYKNQYIVIKPVLQENFDEGLTVAKIGRDYIQIEYVEPNDIIQKISNCIKKGSTFTIFRTAEDRISKEQKIEKALTDNGYLSCGITYFPIDPTIKGADDIDGEIQEAVTLFIDQDKIVLNK